MQQGKVSSNEAERNPNKVHESEKNRKEAKRKRLEKLVKFYRFSSMRTLFLAAMEWLLPWA